MVTSERWLLLNWILCVHGRCVFQAPSMSVTVSAIQMYSSK